MKQLNLTHPAAPVHATDGPLLTWWRDLPARACTLRHADALRLDLARRKMPGETKWRDARQGAAPEAIGVAIRVMRNDEAPPERLDIAMSAVLLCAIEGDAAARLIIIHALSRMEGAAMHLLAESWRAPPAFEKRVAKSFGGRRGRRFAYRARHRRPPMVCR